MPVKRVRAESLLHSRDMLTATDTVFALPTAVAELRKMTLPKLPNPFYMVDKSRSRSMGGAGLGLSTCNEIAKLHGSTLEIVSEVGKGTDISFTVSLADNSTESEGFEDEEI